MVSICSVNENGLVWWVYPLNTSRSDIHQCPSQQVWLQETWNNDLKQKINVKMSFNEYDLIRRKKTNADFVNIKRKITDDNEKYYQIYSCISLLSHIIHNQPLAYRHSHPKYIGGGWMCTDSRHTYMYKT